MVVVLLAEVVVVALQTDQVVMAYMVKVVVVAA